MDLNNKKIMKLLFQKLISVITISFVCLLFVPIIVSIINKDSIVNTMNFIICIPVILVGSILWLYFEIVYHNSEKGNL